MLVTSSTGKLRLARATLKSTTLPGKYFLTGSQNLGMLRSVAESLAGHVGILPLQGMSAQELTGWGNRDGWLPAYLNNPDDLLSLMQ